MFPTTTQGMQGSEYPAVQLSKYGLDNYKEAHYNPENMARAIGGENWHDELIKEKEYLKQKLGHPPGMNQGNSKTVRGGEFQENVTREMSFVKDAQPETPSRVQSVPPHMNLQAPIPQNPRKSVEFASSPDILGGNQDSPAFHSAEMAREDSIVVSSIRQNSVQAVPQTVAFHQKPHSLQDESNSWFRQSHASMNAHASRFPKMTGHQSRTFEQDQKVSAPDSDMQDSSEDEAVAMRLKTLETDKPLERSETSAVAGTKRTLDESNELDYDEQTLRGMNLSELQRQLFSQDPSEQTRVPARDGHGNEMSLNQMLENLSKMTTEAQRQTLHDQTDEEWSKTGQWFIDKFQEDLKQLMVVRLERRKLALKFEDKIRRQQREVEHYQAGVKKELDELQKGGDGLLKDRKVGGASRSATPVKANRP